MFNSIAAATSAVKVAAGLSSGDAGGQGEGEMGSQSQGVTGTQEELEPQAAPEEERAGGRTEDKPAPAPPKKNKKVTVKAPARRSKLPGEHKKEDKQGGGEDREEGREAGLDEFRDLVGEEIRDPGNQKGTAGNPVDAEEEIRVIGGTKGKVDLQGTLLEVIGKALAAEAAGQAGKATMLFKICKGLGNAVASAPAAPLSLPSTLANQTPTASVATPSFTSPAATLPTPTTSIHHHGFKIPTPAPAVTLRIRDYDEMAVPTGTETAILFDNAAIPNNDDIGLPRFFAQNLLEFRAPLPLTIFNEWWQEQAFLHHAEKRGKSDNTSGDRLRYTGFPYPSEYLQTYQEWVPVPGGRLSVANISIFRTEIVQEVHAKTVRFVETEFTDNPYAAGGCRFGWDPTTGQQTEKKDKPANRTPLHLQQPGKQFAKTVKPGPETPKGPSNQKESSGKQGGFKGSKWGSSYDREGGGSGSGGGGGGTGSSYGRGKGY
ncbi:hypothetical protein PTTG_01729 [Puccinia triticina 1-1 BBBD Race 1]|uniref:Uncharacterized protein n=1 Tax=Puccinia triticina (isolate 1-1 / race 1 (BBBD)) TaxID=630390 RepID=A0A180GZ95_PUCT1|nr:hypothetical protein PTTG_01729 [Puccinia triticina 1-1 BBBD Race 1]